MAQNVNQIHKEMLTPSQRFSNWIVKNIGTMYFFYFCCILAVSPLFFTGLLPIVQFVSSAFLQLVLLPLIVISQNLQSQHAELRADEDFRVNVKAEKEVEEIKRRLEAIERKLRK